MRRLLVVVTTLTMLLSLTAGTAFAAKPKAPPATPDAMPVDDMPHPLGAEQAALRAQGLQGYLSGHLEKHGRNGVVQVRRGKFVELDRQGEDTIWTLLGDFGTQINPTTGGTAGPVHNQIPEPDRSVDNTHDLDEGLQPEVLQRPAVLGEEERGLDAQLLPRAVLGPLHGERHGRELRDGALQRGALRHEPLRRHRLLDGLVLRQ